MPIDPSAMAKANTQRSAVKSGMAKPAIPTRPNATPAQMNKLKNIPGLARPAGQRANGLAMGSVRANAARAAAGDPGRQQGLKQGTFNNAQEMQRMMAIRNQDANQLNVGPSQPPYDTTPEVEMMGNNVGGIPQIPEQAMMGSGLDLAPTQLPFDPQQGINGMVPGQPPTGSQMIGMNRGINPQANNPMGSRPGQFGQVNPAIQNQMMMKRRQTMQGMDQQRAQMNQNRMRGGY